LVAVKLFNTGFDGTSLPLFCGAGLAFITAIVNLTLPASPPQSKGKKVPLSQVLGLGSITLMKDKNFTIFIIASFLAFIPFALYWSYLSQFLQDIGYEYITVTMNWGQMAEMLTLLAVPLVIRKFGIRLTMIVGLFALFARYVAFYFGGTADMEWLYFAAILVHGVIYGFFCVGGQIYIDKIAPKDLKAQAQGFIFLVTFGFGILVGNFFNAWLIRCFTVVDNLGQSFIQWDKIWGVTSIISFFVLLFFILFFDFRKGEAR